MATEAGGKAARDRDARGRARERLRAEDAGTGAVRGLVDGFTEASLAFSEELEDRTSCGGAMERSIAGLVRANARFLEELAAVVERASRDAGPRARRVALDDVDYERLADLVAERLKAKGTEFS